MVFIKWSSRTEPHSSDDYRRSEYALNATANTLTDELGNWVIASRIVGIIVMDFEK